MFKAEIDEKYYRVLRFKSKEYTKSCKAPENGKQTNSMIVFTITLRQCSLSLDDIHFIKIGSFNNIIIYWGCLIVFFCGKHHHFCNPLKVKAHHREAPQSSIDNPIYDVWGGYLFVLESNVLIKVILFGTMWCRITAILFNHHCRMQVEYLSFTIQNNKHKYSIYRGKAFKLWLLTICVCVSISFKIKFRYVCVWQFGYNDIMEIEILQMYNSIQIWHVMVI